MHDLFMYFEMFANNIRWVWSYNNHEKNMETVDDDNVDGDTYGQKS